MEQRFSDDFSKVLEFSRDEALRTGWHNICPDHIMLGILRHADNGATRVIEALGLIPDHLKASLDEALFVSEQIPWEERESVNFSDSSLSLLQHAALEAARCGDEVLEPLHFLLAICRISGSYSHDYLDDCGVELRSLVEAADIPWSQYGLAGRPSGMSDESSVMMSRSDASESEALVNEASSPDPTLMAAAIEKRLREGYTTDNPNVS